MMGEFMITSVSAFSQRYRTRPLAWCDVAAFSQTPDRIPLFKKNRMDEYTIHTFPIIAHQNKEIEDRPSISTYRFGF